MLCTNPGLLIALRHYHVAWEVTCKFCRLHGSKGCSATSKASNCTSPRLCGSSRRKENPAGTGPSWNEAHRRLTPAWGSLLASQGQEPEDPESQTSLELVELHPSRAFMLEQVPMVPTPTRPMVAGRSPNMTSAQFLLLDPHAAPWHPRPPAALGPCRSLLVFEPWDRSAYRAMNPLAAASHHSVFGFLFLGGLFCPA